MYVMIQNEQAPKTGLNQNISQGREREKGLTYVWFLENVQKLISYHKVNVALEQQKQV